MHCKQGLAAHPGVAMLRRGCGRGIGLRVAAVVLAGCALLAGCKPVAPSGSQAQGRSILAKVRASGTITLGHRENSIPFSYFDNQQQVVGYAHDISLAIAREIGREAGVPQLQVKLVPVT